MLKFCNHVKLNRIKRIFTPQPPMKHLSKPLKFFLFDGFENSAEEFTAKIFGNPINENEAYKEQSIACDNGSHTTTTPVLKAKPGVYDIFNNKGQGGRNVWGIVVGKNKRQAWLLLKRFENKFNHNHA